MEECCCCKRGKTAAHGGRPTRPQGKNTGRLDRGGAITKDDVEHPNPPGTWGGQRSSMFLPFLYIRTNPGDIGVRPSPGPFWESPDITILSGVDPSDAPAEHPVDRLGDVAVANKPNTIYAHIWNFGKAAANMVFVEFYWVDPSLGISASSVNKIAHTVTHLAPARNAGSNATVKCPVSWTPKFLNGGHECLIVRVWDNPSDFPGEPKFDASVNRHVGQRNIHVVTQIPEAPLTIRVGPLFGAPAKVAVERVLPNEVPWLQLKTGKRNVFPKMATPTGAPALLPPAAIGGGIPTAGANTQHDVTDDEQQIAFMTSDSSPGSGESHVYRISATQGGQLFGGYTVVVIGK